jgi:hypothetical protein
MQANRWNTLGTRCMSLIKTQTLKIKKIITEILTQNSV